MDINTKKFTNLNLKSTTEGFPAPPLLETRTKINLCGVKTNECEHTKAQWGNIGNDNIYKY